jgi:hypothetical protein
MANSDLNPQDGKSGKIQGSSYIYKVGTTPNTRSVVSQKIRILAPAFGETAGLFQIGVLSNFSPSEDRQVDPVQSIGFGDIIAELVPGNTGAMTAQVERTLLYLSNIWQSTGYAGGVSGPVRSLRHHRWPFDIKQEIVFSQIADQELDPSFSGSSDYGAYSTLAYSGATNSGFEGADGSGTHNVLVTFYETCWWTNWSTGYQKDSAMVMESGNVIITDVHDGTSAYGEFLYTGNDPSVIVGGGSQRFNSTFGT